MPCTSRSGCTTALYVAISLGVFGTLTVAEVTHYGATAVAEAARPALGDAGFTAVTIAALLATSSSVNATLYASEGFTGTLAGSASSLRCSASSRGWAPAAT